MSEGEHGSKPLAQTKKSELFHSCYQLSAVSTGVQRKPFLESVHMNNMLYPVTGMTGKQGCLRTCSSCSCSLSKHYPCCHRMERLHLHSVCYSQLFSKHYNFLANSHVPESFKEGDDITEKDCYRIMVLLACAPQSTFCLGSGNAKSQ